MSRRDKVVTLAVVGGVLILLGVLSNSWWRIESGSMSMGLREADFCAGGPFGEMCAVHSFADRGYIFVEHSFGDSFFRYASLTFWVGLLASFSLFGHARI